MKTNSLLLASTAVLVMTAASPQAFAAPAQDAPILLAQATPPAEEKKPEQAPGKGAPPKAAPAKPAPAKPAAPKPPGPPQHQAPPPPRQPAPPPAAAPKPPAAPAPAHTQAPPPPPPPKAPPPIRTQASPAAPPPGAPARQERREDRREERRDQRQQQRQAPQPSQPPAATTPPPAAPKPQAQPAPQPQAQPQPAPQPTFRGPAPNSQPQQAQPQPQPAPQPTFRGAPPPAPPPAAMAPPQPRDAREFIRRDNQGPAPTMDQVRRERHETQQNGSTFIREGDRVIVRQGDRTYIRHSEANRFAIGARDVRVDRRGNQTFTVVQRPDNITIVNITDVDGRLVRRVRRYPDGRQVVIIDNSFARPGHFVDPPPPVIRIPRDRYIVDAWDAQPDMIFGAFMAPPVERIERRYTLDEVRFSEPLRARMPRVDLDINFDSGSWQLTPDQIDKLGVIADGLNRAISRNPREVFLIEGHTDATGNDEDNLSLSDRRAEAVAVALTEQFQVPAENIVTQGYGEQYLKDPTDGPSRVNRRVAVRRITPLIDQQAGGPPPRR